MQRSNIFGTGTLTLAFALISANLQGATFNVSNGSELQTALTTAQNNGEGDTILLAPGTYDASGATFTYVADNSLGSEENFPLTLQGSDATTTLLDGGDANQVMVLDASPLPDDSNADIRIENLTFQNANATTFGAGLLVMTNNADVTLLGSQFLNNETTNFGAGADLQLGVAGGAGNLIANGNLFAGNVANDIAAAEFIVDGGGAVVTNNIFFNNQAVGGTGALLLQYFSGAPAGAPLTLVNNTFFQNVAGADTGALYLFADLSGEVFNVYNNIVFGNSAGTVGQDIFADLGAGVVLNLFNNDFTEICFDLVNCDPAANASVNLGANLNADPLLADPSGGDFSLGLGSPVIDKGDPNAPDLPSLDYLGNPRIAGAAPDMGAFEDQPNISVSPSSLNFGEVLVGTEASQILTLGNDGSGILAVTAITLSDNQNFALDLNQGAHPCGSLPLSFDAGEDCTLAVIFAPDEEGGFSESLLIDSNDPDQPQLSVALTSDSPDLDGGGCSLQGGASPAGFAVAIFGFLGLLGLRLRRN